MRYKVLNIDKSPKIPILLKVLSLNSLGTEVSAAICSSAAMLMVMFRSFPLPMLHKPLSLHLVEADRDVNSYYISRLHRQFEVFLNNFRIKAAQNIPPAFLKRKGDNFINCAEV